MALRNRRLTLRVNFHQHSAELAADVPDDADLQDIEIELRTELERIEQGRIRREDAGQRLRCGAADTPGFFAVMGGGVSGKTAALQQLRNQHTQDMVDAMNRTMLEHAAVFVGGPEKAGSK